MLIRSYKCDNERARTCPSTKNHITTNRNEWILFAPTDYVCFVSCQGSLGPDKCQQHAYVFIQVNLASVYFYVADIWETSLHPGCTLHTLHVYFVYIQSEKARPTMLLILLF